MGGESGPHLKSARLLCPLVHRRCGSLRNSAEPCLLAYLRGPEMKTLKRVQFQRGSSFGVGGRAGCTANYSRLAGRFLFLKIMAILTELRSLSAEHTQQLLRIHDVHPFATPLMQELFSTTNG